MTKDSSFKKMTNIGVDIYMLSTSLERINQYLQNGRNSSDPLETKRYKLLKNLRGTTLIIGHYLGFSDDGSCIFPWDF